MRPFCLAFAPVCGALLASCGGDDVHVFPDSGFVFVDLGIDGRAGDGGHDADRDARSRDAGDAATTRDGGGGRGCAEIDECGDGIDGDCDGVVDQRCPCVPGDVTGCFHGDPAHRGLGACRDGRMVCLGSLEFGTWGPCEDDVTEEEELCDGAGVDEDCDGAPNDGCECVEGDPDLPCGSDVGECRRGYQRCVAGTRTECEGAVGPTAETCNGVDDDCDGTVDEDLVRPCGNDVGVCRPGTETCRDGEWALCAGGVRESPEVCNGYDDDCDGMTDEGSGIDCGTDVGACRPGRQECEDGSLGVCDSAIVPTGELCNAEDDDCDGLTDEDLSRPCGSDVGVCATGLQACDDGKWNACVGAVMPGAEVCDGVLDEDCDGAVDEGCGCAAGAMRSCGSDVGACVAGSQTCDAAGTWGSCVGAIGPTTELCNGIDDDCDATTDEGCGCVTGAMRPCGSDVGACVAGVTTCDASGVWGACVGEIPASTEICNGNDDDCDGQTDEDDVCPRTPPIAMCPGSMSAMTGVALSLMGGGSDPDGGSVTFAWSVVAPLGSTAAPMPPMSATTMFTADVGGSYTLRLCVTDDELQTACCTTTLDVTSPCAPTPAPTITSCGTSWDRRPILEFTPVPAGVVYELYRTGVAAPYATVSTVGHVYHRPATELSAGADPPGETAQLYVRACRTDQPTCCSISSPVTVSLVASCMTPVDASASNIVFSEYLIDGGTTGDPGIEYGEAIEITNLSHCPVRLAGTHFAYRHHTSLSGPYTYRWMDFGASEVIPPRGVYVSVRERAMSMCTFPFLLADDAGLFGLRTSTLAMMGTMIGPAGNGWFNNSPNVDSVLRIASGTWAGAGMTLDPADGRTLEIVQPYIGSADQCSSIGFDAMNACGDDLQPTSPPPSAELTPNQLGRLWRPCDAVTNPALGSGCP